MWTLLFFGLPIAYLSSKKPLIVRAAAIPALLFGSTFGVAFEYINEINLSWLYPFHDDFFFPWKVFGFVPADIVLWYILWIFLIVAYYEYFFDRPTKSIATVHGVCALLLGGAALLAIHAWGERIVIPYTYAVLGLCSLIPVLIVLLRKRLPADRLLYAIPFFGILFLLMELTALSLGYWEFTGQFVLLLSIAQHDVPVEELFFWVIASPAVIIAHHELFTDDER